jgi:hypothetical protein
MDLVTARAELRRLLRVERLEERFAVRRRIDVRQVVVQEAEHRVVAGRQIVHRRVLDFEVPLAHRAPHARDRVARGAPQSRLRLRGVDLLANRAVEAPVEEHGMVMTPGAPLGRLRAHDVLHVLDGLAVPLVVERREAVHRRFPLLEDLLVTAAAALARHEEVRGDGPVHVGVGRRRKEGAARTGAFLVHACGYDGRVLDGGPRLRSTGVRFSGEWGADGQQHRRAACKAHEGALPGVSVARHIDGAANEQQPEAGDRQPDVHRQQRPPRPGGAHNHDEGACDRAGGQHHGAQQGKWIRARPDQTQTESHGERHAQRHVKDDVGEIEERRTRERSQIRGVQHEHGQGNEQTLRAGSRRHGSNMNALVPRRGCGADVFPTYGGRQCGSSG